ncbi:hypothetical protein K469DRAFT_718800 [Zopfia rhizophila CBS 207.26]|uniref:Uncharacterized protein n=1 Tax=Zopfia rhizophila CBS 207.26 TaxID=1314779 RepID=A0A6A6EJD8_9PEZI|nr:hypothetical protein K469DRAFT_718800 [Zopfia rhizophila CBS 207.26]
MSSTTSINCSVSSALSSSSSENMQSPPLSPSSPPPSAHPFLTPGQASTITSWATTLPERGTRPCTTSEVEAMSRDAAIEAYRKLKLALFSKARISPDIKT